MVFNLLHLEKLGRGNRKTLHFGVAGDPQSSLPWSESEVLFSCALTRAMGIWKHAYLVLEFSYE